MKSFFVKSTESVNLKLAGLIHDLRNALSGVSMGAEGLSETSLSQDWNTFARVLQNCGEQAAYLVDQLEHELFESPEHLPEESIVYFYF